MGLLQENITFAYGEETILDDFSVTIPENKYGINGRPVPENPHFSNYSCDSGRYSMVQ